MDMINIQTQEIADGTTLSRYGLDISDLQMCKSFGWVPITIDPEPKYCIYKEKLELLPPEKFSNSLYIRKYKVVPLLNEELYKKTIILKNKLISLIDTSVAESIYKGFDYDITIHSQDVEVLHFNYEKDDQRNFTDTATVVLLILILSGQGMDISTFPESVSWNAYKDWKNGNGTRVEISLNLYQFLELYIAAMMHKLSCLAIGKEKKSYVMNSDTTIDDLISFIKYYKIHIPLYNTDQ